MNRQLVYTLGLLLAVGCSTVHAKVGSSVPLPPQAIGTSHLPYLGIPAYLAEARPLLPVRHDVQADLQCQQRTLACDQRLRATLAALDGQLLALSTPPRDIELEALQLSLQQLQTLLVPYADLMPEQRELTEAVAKLPALPSALQASSLKRMLDLSDLLRIQLAAQ